jgi:cold-inducible RNA-binding protein
MKGRLRPALTFDCCFSSADSWHRPLGESLRPGIGAHQYRIEEISAMKIYAGNLATTTTETELRDAFAAHGAVESSHLATDKVSGRPKGFGFVEMGDDIEAKAAIAALDGSQLGGNAIKVNESKPRI